MELRQALKTKFYRTDSEGNNLLTPFVVDVERRILYFHIAKTGGTSIVRFLRNSAIDDGVLSAKGGDVERKKEYFDRVAQDWNKFFKFTFIRNKYDLLVSLWHFNKRHYKRIGRDFHKFITHYVVPSKDEYDYWIDQYYLTTIDGKGIFDFVGRFENYKDDMKKVCELIGIDYIERKENVGRYDHNVHFSSHYADDLETMVYRKFRKEIDYFGFKIEHPVC